MRKNRCNNPCTNNVPRNTCQDSCSRRSSSCRPTTIVGPAGPQGPPGEPGAQNTAYAKYGVFDSVNSNTLLPFTIPGVDVGGLTSASGTNITLDPGYIYQIDYIFSGAVGTNGSLQIIPRINGVNEFLAAFTGTSNAATNGNATSSGSFVLDQSASAEATLSFFLASSQATDISVDGIVSIFPIAVAS